MIAVPEDFEHAATTVIRHRRSSVRVQGTTASRLQEQRELSRSCQTPDAPLASRTTTDDQETVIGSLTALIEVAAFGVSGVIRTTIR